MNAILSHPALCFRMLLSFSEHLHLCTSVIYRRTLLSGECSSLCACHKLCSVICLAFNLTLPYLLNSVTCTLHACRIYVLKYVLCCEQNMQICLFPLTLNTHEVAKRQRGYVQCVRLFQPCRTDLLNITHRLVPRSKNGRHIKCYKIWV